MQRLALRALVACAVLATTLAAAGVARADVISEWNAFAQAQTIPIRPTARLRWVLAAGCIVTGYLLANAEKF